MAMSPNGHKGIGPRLYPYRSQSEAAKVTEDVGPYNVFYSPEKDPTKVKCPWAGEDTQKGDVIKLNDICLLVPCETGRIKSETLKEGKIRMEFACCCHLPPNERIPLEEVTSYTPSEGSETFFYDRHPDKIQKDFVPKPVAAPKAPPVIS